MAIEGVDQQKTNQTLTDVIFLFGAGASVDAGIPDTYRFVEEFKSHIKQNHPKYYDQLLGILKIREGFNKKGPERKEVDIEQLLDTLNRLIDKDKEVLLDFYESKVFIRDILDNKEIFQKLKELLQDFIRERVIVKEEKSLEYLKELLNFNLPLEIYSVNYDTCIEQLSHMSHMRYTDGFDTYWDKTEFDEDFHVKHYKMHGSVIWHENRKTKEIVKIPVYAPIEKESNKIKLIYGEDVEPLLLYPAQKSEYVEPLTELQLMFKNRLLKKETKIVIVVGYSFRDDYIVHMLWDAGRINEDLHIILVNPSAHELFKNRLKFIDKRIEALSRISNRVLCLPYPFSTAINQLRNHYISKLENIIGMEKEFLKLERDGRTTDWNHFLRVCIECEFSSKVEQILKDKIRKNWSEISFGNPYDNAVYGVRAMLHSIASKDGREKEWVSRVNDSLKHLDTRNLKIAKLDMTGFSLSFKINGSDESSFGNTLKHWINPILCEKDNKLKMLSKNFEKHLAATEENFKRLNEFREYLQRLQGFVSWEDYNKLRKTDIHPEPEGGKTSVIEHTKYEEQVLKIERNELTKIFGGNTFQFMLDVPSQKP
jgi:hypothetical protein